MKKLLTRQLILLLAIFILSCNQDSDTRTSAVHHFEAEYHFEIVDSILAAVTGPNVLCVDHNTNGDLLLIDNSSGSHVFIVDSTGHLKSTFSPVGFDTGKVGGAVSNLAFLNDSTLLISGNKGYSFFDFSGQQKRLIYCQNTQPVSGISKQLFAFTDNRKDTIVTSVFRSPLTYERLLDPRGLFRGYVDSIRFLTFHNINTNQYEIKIGYEPGGWHKQYKYAYSEPFLPAFDKKNKGYYGLFSPEPVIYYYPASGDFNLKKKIPLALQYFDYPIKFQPDQPRTPEEYGEAVARNAAFQSIHAFGELILVIYRTGIPEDRYNRIESREQLSEVLQSGTRKFAVLVDHDRQLSSEIELPQNCSGVAQAIDTNKILMYAYDPQAQATQYTKLYVCRLVSAKQNK